MRNNFYILWVGALYLLILEGMEKADFWSAAGISETEPHGIRWMGGIFLFLLFIMTELFFRPYMTVLEERDAQTVKKKEGAAVTRKKADEMIEAYRSQIDETRRKAVTEREKHALEAEEEEATILKKAREEGSEEFDSELAKVESEADAALADLKGSVHTFAEDIVNQVLNQPRAPRSKKAKEVRATG